MNVGTLWLATIVLVVSIIIAYPTMRDSFKDVDFKKIMLLGYALWFLFGALTVATVRALTQSLTP